MNDLTYTETNTNGELIIKLTSDVNLFNIDKLIYLVKNSENKKVVLDLSLSKFIDSAAVNKLALLQHRFIVEAKELKFIVNENYRLIFKYFKLT